METSTHPHDAPDLADRLAALTAAGSTLPELSGGEVAGQVGGLRAYLHDLVLPQAHREELTLFPLLRRHGGWRAAALAVEHDTVRLATAQLDDLATGPLTAARVHALDGLLRGIHLLLAGHLDHEGEACREALVQLGGAPPAPARTSS